MKKVILLLLFLSFLLIPSFVYGASARQLPVTFNENDYDTAGGRDYTSLVTWEGDTNIDLVTAENGEVLNVFAGQVHADENNFISGATTDASYFRVIRAEPGQGHTGIPLIDGTKAAFVDSGGNNDPYRINDNFFQIQDLVFKYTGSDVSNGGVLYVRDANDVVLVGCMVIDSTSSGGEMSGFWNESTTGSIIVDCLAHNNETEGFFVDSGVANYYNCSAIENGQHGFARSSGTMNVKNCLSDGNTSDDYNGTIASSTTSGSSDTTSSDSGQRNQTYTYESGTDNFQLSSGSDGIDEGTDLSTDGTFAFDDDLVKATWTVLWDEGCYQAAAVAGGIVVLRRRIETCNQCHEEGLQYAFDD